MNYLTLAFKDNKPTKAISELTQMFGIRSLGQVGADLSKALKQSGSGFQFDLSSLGFFRPDLGIPTYQGKYPKNRLAPIFHCFDRVGGGKHYSQRVTRKTATDFRGLPLSYDEHDGVDFACPIGTKLVAAAPGHVVMIRDNWLRGGITIAVDHGHGLITQYTHCWKPLVNLGQYLRRGEPLALSGSAGLDMTISFPWLPPHLHFMVWDHGRPVDPFLKANEADHAGTWLSDNTPTTALNLETSPPLYSTVHKDTVLKMAALCTDDKLVKEMQSLNGNPHFLAAYLEDSFHHDGYAWPEKVTASELRPREESTTKLTLPLCPNHYEGAFFADYKISDKSFWID